MQFAKEKRKGQFFIGGAEYIPHPMATARFVCQGGYGTEVQIETLFHDLPEAPDVTFSAEKRIVGELEQEPKRKGQGAVG